MFDTEKDIIVPNILGPDGRPVRSASLQASLDLASQRATVPGIRGGWSTGAGLSAAGDPTSGFALDRDTERRAARLAFYVNPVVGAINELLVAYLVGDDFSYGIMDDKRAYAALGEWWDHNNLPDLAERIMVEHLIDGETAAITEPGAELQDRPGRVALLDVDRGIELEYDTFDGVTEIRTQAADGSEVVYEAGEFVWSASTSLYNDPRGWPPFMRAIPVALSYVGLVNSRLRTNEIHARINGVYSALYYHNPHDPKGSAEEFAAKQRSLTRIPANGSIMTVAVDAATGRQEKFEYLKGGEGASNAKEDATMMRLLMAIAFGIPMTWFGDGQTANRASAQEMNGPPLRLANKRQARLRSILTQLFRNDLKRRYGANQTYRQSYQEDRVDKTTGQILGKKTLTKKVLADNLDIPFVLPTIDDAYLEELILKARHLFDTKTGSVQTQQEILGLDPAEEAERMAREGTQAGVERVDLTDRGNPGDTTTDETTDDETDETDLEPGGRVEDENEAE
jgi:hypothetical protein